MKNITYLILLVLLAGCTSFHVQQTDGKVGERVTTTNLRATAWFSSAQHLEKLRAFQSEKTQSFGMADLTQQGATNTAATLQALANLLQVLMQSAPK